MECEVYWNSHKKCFSIRNIKTRKVIDHKRSLLLKNCTLRVGQKARKKVLQTMSKNVHAFIRGIRTFTLGDQYGHGGFKTFGYNPYKHNSFVILPDENPVTQADLVMLTSKKGKPVCKGINLR